MNHAQIQVPQGGHEKKVRSSGIPGMDDRESWVTLRVHSLSTQKRNRNSVFHRPVTNPCAIT